jgi:hypothetical protein
MSSPTLIVEALLVGYSLDEIRQAANELEALPSPASKAYSKLKQGSISKRIVDVWVDNRKGKIKPWVGPLPPPRQSPMRPFRDVFAKALIVEKSKPRCWQTRRSPIMSSVGLRRKSTPAVTMANTSLCSRRATNQDREAPFKGNSKSPGRPTELGCHVLHMGHKSESDHHRFGYRPTPGLMSLFSKTGVCRLNPKPLVSHTSCHRSYADVVHDSIEQGGASSNSNRPRYGQHGY